jgi:hypothetical protein
VKIDKKAIRLVHGATGAAAIIFIGLYVHSTWRQIDLSWAAFRWNCMALSCVFLGAGFFVGGLVWKILLSSGRKKAGYFDSVFMVSIAMLMRYIPGKIWQLAGRYSMASGRGFDRSTVVVSLAEEAAADICGACIVGYAAFGRQQGFFGLLFPVAMAAAVVLISQKSIRERFRVPAVRGGRIAVATALCVLNWIGYGCAFFFTVRSLYAIDVSHVLLLSGSLAVAWVGGMVSFIAPNGLGVREGLLVLLLAPVIPAPQAMAAALVFRLLSTVVELSFGGAMYCVNGLARNRIQR